MTKKPMLPSQRLDAIAAHARMYEEPITHPKQLEATANALQSMQTSAATIGMTLDGLRATGILQQEIIGMRALLGAFTVGHENMIDQDLRTQAALGPVLGYDREPYKDIASKGDIVLQNYVSLHEQLNFQFDRLEKTYWQNHFPQEEKAFEYFSKTTSAALADMHKALHEYSEMALFLRSMDGVDPTRGHGR